jgi:hypothetical protein
VVAPVNFFFARGLGLGFLAVVRLLCGRKVAESTECIVIASYYDLLAVIRASARTLVTVVDSAQMVEEAKQESPAVPFLRWAGSKRQLVPTLKQFWRPTHRRYVEPFAGSACLFFALRPRTAVLGDANPELMATYSAIKHDLDRVLTALHHLSNNPQTYLKVRSMNPSRLSKVARAARFIYLNRFCFNGLYRTNVQGRFNVPYGGIRSGKLPSPVLFKQCSMILESAKLIWPLHEANNSLKPEVKERLRSLCSRIDDKSELGYKGLAAMVVFYRNAPNSLPVVFRGNVDQEPYVGIFPRIGDLPKRTPGS